MSLKEMLRTARTIGRIRVRPAEGFGAITLPLAAYYRGDPEKERRRAEFYAQCAFHFGFTGWTRTQPAEVLGKPGRDGTRELIEKYGHHAIASFRNNMAHPVEFFEASPRLLQDKRARAKGKKEEHLAGAERRRVRLARWWHEIKLGSQITPLGAVDAGAVGGGGGFGPRTPADHAVDCIRKVVEIEALMPARILSTLNACLFEGRFVFDLPKKKERETVLDQIRLGLDFVALGKREITDEELVETWPEVAVFRYEQQQRAEASRRRRLRRLQRDAK